MWHTLDLTEVVRKLRSNINYGIMNEEAKIRMEKYGKNTIVLLVTNNLLIEMIRLIDYKITGNILIRLGIFGSILFTVGLLIIEWWFIKVANGPLGFLFGRMRKEER